MFEPVHGSAPPIAGKDIANPFAAALTVGMLPGFMGHEDLESVIETGVQGCIAAGECTRDVGGTLGTRAAAEALRKRIAVALG